MHKAPVLLAQLLPPLLGVGREVDLEWIPLPFLPVPVEGLGVVQVDVHTSHEAERTAVGWPV